LITIDNLRDTNPVTSKPNRSAKIKIAKGVIKVRKFKVNRRYFEEKIAGLGLSHRKFAAKIQLDHVLISRILAGIRPITLEEAATFARLFEVSVEEIMLQAGIKSAADLHKAGTVHAGEIAIKGWVDGELRIHWEAPKGSKTAPRPEGNGGRARDVQVVRFQTGGTRLDAMDGALAYFRGQRDLAPDAIGRQCVVKIVGDESNGSLLCVVKRGYREGTYNLMALNGETITENAFVESASPVLWIKFQ
jgi:plasmid maintenance system antidote protein VapI